MPKPRKLDAATDACLAIIVSRVSAATTHVRALGRYRRRGDIEAAFQAALEIEPLIREANYALQAASLFRREHRKA